MKSIGMGNTNCLSSLNGLRQVRKDNEEDGSSNLNPQKLNIKVCKHYITKFIQLYFCPPSLSVKNISLQAEPVLDLNDTDTEDEEENERLSQKFSHSPENSGLISDNSEVSNASIIGNGVGVGCHANLVSVKEETGTDLDIKISIWNSIKCQYMNNN